jgi:hypothetical protein
MTWDREGDLIVGHFTPREIAWIRQHLQSFAKLLHLGRQHITDDEQPSCAATAADRQAYRCVRIIAAQRGQDREANTLSRTQALEFLNQTQDAVDLTLATVPRRRGVVVLYSSQQSWAWIWALYEYGIALACKLGVDWEPIHHRLIDPTGRQQRAFHAVMKWLHQIVDELVQIADLPIPALNP